MAITDGTIVSVGQHSTNAGPVVNGSGVPIFSCIVAATVTGTSTVHECRPDATA